MSRFPNRRDLLAAGAAALAMPTMPAMSQDLRSLRALAQARGVVFGCAAASYEFRDADFPPLLAREAGQLVPEYEMKRHVLEPQPGAYDFSGLDALFGFAARSGQTMRGHPLVWYASNPPWLAPALAARRDEKLMTDHIHRVLTRYRGRMASVDVVNEAIAPDGSGLRPSPWLAAFGPGYIDTAFHAARDADPDIRLVYNDFGCESGANDRFRATTLHVLDGMLARHTPINALGMQAHLAAFGPRVDQRKLRDFLNEVRARGLAILVTELDVEDSGGSSDPAVRDQAAADEARRFLDVVLDNPATVAVLTWGLTDRYIDPPDDWKLKLMGWKPRKLPFDAQLRRKPLSDAMAQSFSARKLAY